MPESASTELHHYLAARKFATGRVCGVL